MMQRPSPVDCLAFLSSLANAAVRHAKECWPHGLWHVCPRDPIRLTSEILTSFRINLSLFGEKSGGDLWSGKGSLTLSKTGTDVRRHGLARGFPDDGSRP